MDSLTFASGTVIPSTWLNSVNTSAYAVSLALALGSLLTTADVGVMTGYPNIPQNIKSANYTTVAADSGKHIYHPSTDDNARTWTIAANASVAYAIGTVITFVNDKNTITIAINSDTLAWAQDGSTGSRTLAVYGVATAIKVTATRWIISGTGLT